MRYELGQKIGAFKITNILNLEELQSTLYELEHEKLGSQVLALSNDDKENLFCISFQTLPTSSNGVPHILEHTALCGSKKFPIKDPFFSMHRRSLATFMNAMTGSDFTCYPASSMVEKDYFNLLEVYLDAVFQPNLTPESFLQEGHRLEFSEGDDSSTPLLHKGIVFNEMKGALATAEARLWHMMMEKLTPELPYAYDSGGHPKEIPDLTHEELVAFHQNYYHPSRSLFFFYGDLPLEKNLDFIEKNALKDFDKKPPLPPIKKQKRFNAPQRFHRHYPSQPDETPESRTFLSFGWLTMSIEQQEELLAFVLLDSILMDTDSSLLKKRLFESKLFAQVDSMLDNDMSEVPYLIIFKGTDCAKEEEIEKLLFSSLEAIANEGIPDSLIEASLHQLELGRSEIGGNHSPFGLALYFRSGLIKQHGCKPENGLLIHDLFRILRLKTKDKSYLPNLIRKYLLNNSHLVKISLTPNPKLLAEEQEEENQNLKAIRAKLSENETKQLVKQAKDLDHYQRNSEKQSLDCLPSLTSNDIPKEVRDYPLIKESKGMADLYFHDCFTNELLYVDLVWSLPEITPEELPLLKLLGQLIPEVGVGKLNYAESLDYLHAYTGGISASFHCHTPIDQPQTIKPVYHIRGKSLYRYADKLINHLKNVVTSVRFDEKQRIWELVHQYQNSLQNQLNNHAIKYATLEALSSYHPSHGIAHQAAGYPYFKMMQKLKEGDNTLFEKLEQFKKKIFSFNNLDLLFACDKKMHRQLENENFYNLDQLANQRKELSWDFKKSSPTQSCAYELALPVSFTAQAHPSKFYLDPLSPALNIASLLMENKVLHHEIREIGGAYGSGAHYNPLTGTFYFHTYRDPHLKSSIESFKNAIESIRRGDFSKEDLEEAKIGTIQHSDSPVCPGGRTLYSHSLLLDNKSKDQRQAYREKMLKLSKEDISNALSASFQDQKETTVTYAGKELLAKEKIDLPTRVI